MKKYKNPGRQEWAGLCKRPAEPAENLSMLVAEVFDAVAAKGDKAVFECIQRFEQRSTTTLKISPETMENAAGRVSPELQEAIRLAAGNIERFHQSQREEPRRVQTMPGITCWRESRPIERIGIYIPGGSAPLFSTVLMLGIPARLAGCREVAMCTPADASGDIHPAILYAAQFVGITQVFAVGGIQAIAAMALGSESTPAVDKIFGPGNRYVTAAKMHAQSLGVAIDLPAGPSELLVIADETAVPAFVAADLLAQAEHGPDSQVTLLSNNEVTIDAVLAELERQIVSLPRRDIAAKALACSQAILFSTISDCFAFSNVYAPEHLIIATDDAAGRVDELSSAGSVFLGHYSCESAGDYASGTNHTLPTNGFARGYSGVSLDSFIKKITFQHISRRGIAAIGPAIELMAEAEGLRAHREAVSIRLTQTFQNIQNMNANDPQQLPFRPLKQLVRPNIWSLAPYTSDRNGAESGGLIYLDANESPSGSCNRYPDGGQLRLKEQIGRMRSLPADQIFVGNGSDEIIDLCFRVFCRPGIDKALTYGPTFSMYKVIAQLNDVTLEALPLDEDFQAEPALLEPFRADETARLLLLCSPNNPTGNSFERLETLVQSFSGITLIDEAYIDFSNRPSFLGKLAAYPNMTVCQTFSKARALAGARVGVAFADRQIIKLLDAARMPYNISTLNQAAAMASLDQEEAFGQRVQYILSERDKLITRLSASPFVQRVYPSDANFILIRVKDAPRMCKELREHGILVRDQSSDIPCCLRITVGTSQENVRLVTVINRLSKQTVV